MLFGILLTIQIIISLALGGLVLIQRSEGGALGMGAGPSGFMSARGAGNLLTRATAILGFLFFSVAIAMTIVGNIDSRRGSELKNIDMTGLTSTPATAPASQAPAAATAASSSSVGDIANLPLAGATQASSSASAVAPATSSAAPAAKPAVKSATPASASSASSSAP